MSGCLRPLLGLYLILILGVGNATATAAGAVEPSGILGQEAIDRGISEAKRLVAEGALDAAERRLLEIVDTSPAMAEAYYQLGSIAVKRQRFESAAGYFTQASNLAPQQVIYHLSLARVLEYVGQDLEAAEAYATVIQYAEPETEFFLEAVRQLKYVIATAQAKRGNVGVARQMFSELAADYPDNVLIRYSLGVAALLSGQFDLAEAEFKKVVGLDPGYANAYLNLATVAESQGRLSDQIEYLDKTVEVDPEGGVGLKAAGKLAIIEARLLREAGNPVEAAIVLEEAFSRHPGDQEVAQNLLDIYRGLGDYAGELRVLRSLVEVYPNLSDVRIRIAVLANETGDVRLAFEQLREVGLQGSGTEAREALKLLTRLRSVPGNSEIEQGLIADQVAELEGRLAEMPQQVPEWIRLGKLYVEQGRLEEAKGAFMQVVSIDPRHVEGYSLLGQVSDALNQFDQAVEALARAISLELSDQNASRLVVLLLLDVAKGEFYTGDVAEARQRFEEVLILDAANVMAHFYLGMIYAREGEQAKAVDAYQQVVNVIPTHAGARFNLALSYERLNQEEEALEEYRRIVASNAPAAMIEAARERVRAVEKRIRGISSNLGYVLGYNDNISQGTGTKAGEIKTDLYLNLAYQYKLSNGIRLRLLTAPVYSTYHENQFDFLNTSTTVTASLTPRDTAWVTGYTRRTTQGLVAADRFSDSNTFFVDGLLRYRLPKLLSPWVGGRVSTDVSGNVAYTDFDSNNSPFFSAYTTTFSAALTQPFDERSTVSLGYGIVDNSNKEYVGSDYAYRGHSLNIGFDRAIADRVVANAKYDITLIHYSHPDSNSGFSQYRRNRRHTVNIGATYRYTDRVNIFATVSWAKNDSNLPVGVILNAEDIIEGQQSTSLSNYHQTLLSMGLSVNF